MHERRLHGGARLRDPPASAGTACNQNGGTKCDGANNCVQCSAAIDCGASTACVTFTCTSGVCGQNNTTAGTVVGNPVPGDCHTNQCDGSGNTVPNAIDNTDVPADDGNQCTGETCVAGSPQHPQVSQGTACNQGGGHRVRRRGQLRTGARSPPDCGVDHGLPDPHTCTGGACGVNDTPSGTIVSNPVVGDCRADECDGNGNLTSNAVDDADVPAPISDCSTPSCSSGTGRYSTPLAAGTACSTGGGTECDGNGNCVSVPAVASTSPSDATTPTAAPTVSVTFTLAMNPATLTAQTAAGGVHRLDPGLARRLRLVRRDEQRVGVDVGRQHHGDLHDGAPACS